MRFEQFVAGVQEGIDTYSRFIQGGNTSGRLTGPIGPFQIGHPSTEATFQAAIALGLNNQRNRTNTNPLIKTFWCPDNIHNHLNNIETKKKVIKSEWQGEEIAKTYDLAWSDRSINRIAPDWYCQIKIHISGHPKASEALGDLFWGYVDKKYILKRHSRDVEMVFIWAEHKDYRHADRFLHFEENEGEMKLKLEPGFREYLETPQSQKIRLGNMEYENFAKHIKGKPERYWWDRNNAILYPNNFTAIKRILACVSNGSFYRQYRQKGCLIINTNYKQIISQCGNWHVYIHHIKSGRLMRADGKKLFEWIP